MEIKKSVYWKEIITPREKWLHLNFKELWSYRDLIFILTKRDISAVYKQTVLGPLWFFLQPALTTIIYVLVFSRAGRLSTGSLPPVLFYVSGLVLWIYFSECVTKTATFLKDNSSILTKVYFPRLIVPISIVLTNLVKFSIQFLLFLGVYLFYFFSTDILKTNTYLLFFPVLVLLLGLFGLGAGVLVSSLTTRYKDLSHLITFGVQLLMFTSPVIFPLSSISDKTVAAIIKLNPITGIIEAFRFVFLSEGVFNISLLMYDTLAIVLLLVTSIFAFNRVERKFADTI